MESLSLPQFYSSSAPELNKAISTFFQIFSKFQVNLPLGISSFSYGLPALLFYSFLLPLLLFFSSLILNAFLKFNLISVTLISPRITHALQYLFVAFIIRIYSF